MDETQDETDTAQAVKATAIIPYAEKLQLYAYQIDICYGKFDNKQELMKRRITVLIWICRSNVLWYRFLKRDLTIKLYSENRELTRDLKKREQKNRTKQRNDYRRSSSKGSNWRELLLNGRTTSLCDYRSDRDVLRTLHSHLIYSLSYIHAYCDNTISLSLYTLLYVHYTTLLLVSGLLDVLPSFGLYTVEPWLFEPRSSETSIIRERFGQS